MSDTTRSGPIQVRLEENTLLSQQEYAGFLERLGPDAGAVVTFTGRTRDSQGDTPLVALELEHYPGMTEASIRALCAEALERWPLQAIQLAHRIGPVAVAEDIVFVAVSSPHRADAFSACEFLMDALKSRVPLWKKAVTSEGSRWIDANPADQRRAERWD